MKKVLIILFTALCTLANAQDYTFFEKLKTVETPEDAEVLVAKMAAQLKGKFVYYKTKQFDNGLLRIVYTPEGMAEEAVKAQADYEDCFVADFKPVPASTDKAYNFDKARAKYETLFPLWQKFFKPDATPDNKTQRFSNPEKNVLFSFINMGEVWAIGR